MHFQFCRRVVAVIACACAVSVVPTAHAQNADDGSDGTLSLGGQVVLRLRASAGGLTPKQRIAVIMNRLDRVIGVPFLTPADVVVFVPPKGQTGNQAPVIYALGRRLITVDAATVQAAGGGQPLPMAETWAKRFQQILPRIDWRPTNAPENLVPPHPPLLVTSDFTQVGGSVGDVNLYDHLVIRLHGPQPDGSTAAERADALTARLTRIAHTLNLADPNAVAVVPSVPDDANASASLNLGGTPFLTVGPAEAKASGATTPVALAQSWAKNIRRVLGIPLPVAAAPPAPELPPGRERPTPP